jgi:hypothetical protein
LETNNNDFSFELRKNEINNSNYKPIKLNYDEFLEYYLKIVLFLVDPEETLGTEEKLFNKKSVIFIYLIKFFDLLRDFNALPHIIIENKNLI